MHSRQPTRSGFHTGVQVLSPEAESSPARRRSHSRRNRQNAPSQARRRYPATAGRNGRALGETISNRRQCTRPPRDPPPAMGRASIAMLFASADDRRAGASRFPQGKSGRASQQDQRVRRASPRVCVAAAARPRKSVRAERSRQWKRAVLVFPAKRRRNPNSTIALRAVQRIGVAFIRRTSTPRSLSASSRTDFCSGNAPCPRLPP